MARDKYKIFVSPAGFIETHFTGNQTPDSVIDAVEELVKRAKKLKVRKELVLVLVDVTDVPKIDISKRMARAHQQAVKAMTTARDSAGSRSANDWDMFDPRNRYGRDWQRELLRHNAAMLLNQAATTSRATPTITRNLSLSRDRIKRPTPLVPGAFHHNHFGGY